MLLLTLLGGCADGPTAPAAAPEPAAQLARGGSQQSTPPTVVEPFLLGQASLYAAEGVVRQCVVNPFEDLDGDDWVRADPSGTVEQFFFNEHDAFVLIREAPASPSGPFVPVGIGRAVWKMNAWYAVGSSTPVLSAIDSRVQGVVAPLDVGSPGPHGAVLDLLAAADPPYNLSTVPLGPGDPAVEVIDEALRVAGDQGTLRGVDCEWNQGWKPFVVNEVRWVSHWPRALARLF